MGTAMSSTTPAPLRLALLGMVEGNGHPYSWGAILNGGFDREGMRRCGYPVIAQYLEAEPAGRLGFPGVSVTHVWCDDPADGEAVAAAVGIPTVCTRPEEVIGQVDGVLITTDIGAEHVERVRPFIEAGIPAFIDKPMTDNFEDLKQFRAWKREGRRFLSSSAMRYARELTPHHAGRRDGALGELRLVTATSPKSWERYGIHALEAVYPILGPGFTAVRHSGDDRRNIVHLEHRCGADAVVVVTEDLYGGFGLFQVAGTKDSVQVRFRDTFTAFRDQLATFVDYLRSGKEPVPFSETDELMCLVIAALDSRSAGGRRICLTDYQEPKGSHEKE